MHEIHSVHNTHNTYYNSTNKINYSIGLNLILHKCSWTIMIPMDYFLVSTTPVITWPAAIIAQHLSPRLLILQSRE